MSGQKVGYIRVSTLDQKSDRQLVDEPLDRVFEDKVSGKDIHRPKLLDLLEYVRTGDTVIVHSMDRLARNLDDLRSLVRQITGKGACLRFVKENLTFTKDESPMSTLLLSVMGAFAEFERALIRERQREGIELAKKRGAYKGRKKKLSEEQVFSLKERVVAGESKTILAKELSISRETLYQYLRK